MPVEIGRVETFFRYPREVYARRAVGPQIFYIPPTLHLDIADGIGWETLLAF